MLGLPAHIRRTFCCIALSAVAATALGQLVALGPAQAQTIAAPADRPALAPRVDVAATTDATPVKVDAAGVPAPPDDVTASKVYTLLDQACAQCHQTGRLKGRTVPAGGLANILALDEIVTAPALVRPGLPDASRLYDVLLRRHAPLSPLTLSAKDAGERQLDRPWPTSTEIQTVRDWIAGLPRETGRAQCTGREKVTPEQIASEITRVVTDTPAALQPGLRFVSLAALHNACVSDADLETYRQAVTRLVNSLSWAERPQILRSAGPGNTLIVMNLKDLRWIPAHWQRLVAMYPFAPALDAPLDEGVLKLVETPAPVLRADWFALAASTAPLYYDLIGLPTRMRDLEQILNVNAVKLVLRGAAVRAGIESSTITLGPRMVERLPARTGSLWRAYDLPASKPGEGLAATPIGPEGVDGVERVFRPAGAKVMFSSPNGFMMFGQFDSIGDRVDRAPDGTDRAEIHRLPVAHSCMSCHTAGPIAVRDEVRLLAFKDTTQKPVRDAILALHPEQSSIDGLMTEDRQQLQRSLAAAGVDVKRTVRGRDPLAALIARYEQAGDIDAIAIEAGRTREDIQRLTLTKPDDIRVLVLRAHTGPIARVDMNRVLAAVTGHDVPAATPPEAPVAETTGPITVTPAPVAAKPGAAPGSSVLAIKPGPIDLAVWPNQPEFRTGDLAAFNVRASSDCYLTLVGVDNRGIATVLFPNDFEPDNLLPAGRTLKIPSDQAAYQFRLKGTGREHVVAMCTQQARTFAGMEHDFERTRFTVLGNWSVFISDQLDLVEKHEADAAARARSKSKERPEKPELPSIASNYGRAAIGYEIKQ